MDLTKEDRKGEECSTEISLGSTPHGRPGLRERREAGVPGGVEIGRLE